MNRCQHEAPPRADDVAPGQAECRMSNKEFRMMKFDAFVKSRKMASPVIPAKAGIQEKQALLDPGFRRGDGFDGMGLNHLIFRSW
jgi:hypothetical protein